MFFINKIRCIRETITTDTVPTYEILQNNIAWNRFTVINAGTIEKILQSLSDKSCDLDPIPSKLIKKYREFFTPYLVQVINASLISGYVPSDCKKSIIFPKLKKDNLDPENFNNYRPVSNISLLAKILEKTVLDQLQMHIKTNDISDMFQSAYKESHSVETCRHHE